MKGIWIQVCPSKAWSGVLRKAGSSKGYASCTISCTS